jgi:hypothetical protein
VDISILHSVVLPVGGVGSCFFQEKSKSSLPTTISDD